MSIGQPRRGRKTRGLNALFLRLHMQTAALLLAVLLALAAPGFSIDARGLPVYSADGSVDTSGR